MISAGEAAIARRSAATAGYLPASSSRLPSSTSAGTTPGHSVLATPADQTRGVEGVAGDEELDALSGAQIRPDHHPLALAVAAQQEDLERIAEIIVVELVVADAVEPHRGVGRHHEIEPRAHRSPIGERRRQPAGRDRQRAQIGDPHEAAGFMRSEILSIFPNG
jgi:hypothetical protein